MSEPAAKPAVINDRRDFLIKLGTGAGACALGVQALASARSLVPNVSYDAPTTVKLGPPSEFSDGLKFLADERLFIFRDGNTFHAVSAVCTHLGCTVRAEALPRPETATVGGSPLKLTHKFSCPCHGGAYDAEGNRTAGPPVRALDRYEYSIRGGNLHLGKMFSVGTVKGTGADARIRKYNLAAPGQHVDGWEWWLYPLQPPS